MVPEFSVEQHAAASPEPQDSDESSEGSDDDELVTAMATTTLEDSEWKTTPAYPPMYLSTSAEYLPPAPKPRNSPEEAILEEADGKGKEATWGMESYENSLDLDHVFERFMRRVGHHGEQCIR